MKTKIVVIIVAVILAALRITGEKSESFQAVSHLFVGGLFGSCLVTRHWPSLYSTTMFYFMTGIILSIVELAVFLYNMPV